MIVIDLDKSTLISDNYTTLQRRFFTEIIKIRNQNIINNMAFDKLVVSTSIFNFISDSSGFYVVERINNPDLEDDSLVKMGYILDHVAIWVDLELERNKGFLTFDDEQVRDMKIEDILSEETDQRIYRVDIEIKSDLL